MRARRGVSVRPPAAGGRPGGGGDRAGFTLVEVLVAMVILAVGLLAVEALAIGAARSMAGAGTQSRISNAATRTMEIKQQEVRNSLLAGALALPTLTLLAEQSCGVDSLSTLYVCSSVHTTLTPPQTGPIPAKSAQIQVHVARTSEDPFFSLTSYVYHPALP